MRPTYDVIIVGGGIMGCSTAFRLAQQGVRVAVVEKENLGAGSTDKSSAIIRQHYSNETTARMALFGLRFFQRARDEVGDDCGFTQAGYLVVAGPEDEANLRANVALLQSLGVPTQVVERTDLEALMPGISADDLGAAAWEPESGYADPHLTVQAVAAAARRLGVVIHRRCPVIGVRTVGDRVVGVDTAAGPMDAPVVVDCAGPWAPRVAGHLGVTLPIEPRRAQVAVFRRPPGYERPHPVVSDFVLGSYFRSETGGLTLVGLKPTPESHPPADPDRYDEGVDPDFVLAAGERLVGRYPPMEQAQSLRGYAGIYAVTPDWHPIVDEAPPGSGFFVCAGFSGHGFKLSPAVGVMMAERILGVQKPTFDAHIFRLSRYAEGEPIQGRYRYGIAG